MNEQQILSAIDAAGTSGVIETTIVSSAKGYAQQLMTINLLARLRREKKVVRRHEERDGVKVAVYVKGEAA